MITASRVPPGLAAHHVHVTGSEGTAILVLVLVAVLWARRARHVPVTVTGDGGLAGLAALAIACAVLLNMHPARHAPAAVRATPSPAPRPSPVITHMAVAHSAGPSALWWGVIAAIIIAILVTGAVKISRTAINATLRRGD